MILHTFQQLTWLNITTKLMVLVGLLCPQVEWYKCQCSAACPTAEYVSEQTEATFPEKDTDLSEESQTPSTDTQPCCCSGEAVCLCCNPEENSQSANPSEKESQGNRHPKQETQGTTAKKSGCCGDEDGSCNCSHVVQLNWQNPVPTSNAIQTDTTDSGIISNFFLSPVESVSNSRGQSHNSLHWPPWRGATLNSVYCKWLI